MGSDKISCEGYDTANALSNGATPVIPHKGVPKNSELTPDDFLDKKLYKERNIIERFFDRLKENKRIAMRFDKHTFLSFIALAIANLTPTMDKP